MTTSATGRQRRAVAVLLGVLSAAAYLVMWVYVGTGCTGTGAAQYGCEAFECVWGDRVTAVEVLVVTPALVLAMLRIGRTAAVRNTVWTLAMLWLVAGRFALYLSLAGRTVRDCLPG